MPNMTGNYGLKKPLPEEFYDIAVHNENMDKIDEELKKKFGVVRGLSTGEDLNTVVSAGSYAIGSSVAPTIINTPTPYAFHMYVFTGDGDMNRVVQIVTRTDPRTSTGNILWYRIINTSNSVYGDWKQIATTDYAVNKTGDETTGLMSNTLDGTGRGAFVGNGDAAYVAAYTGNFEERRQIEVWNNDKKPDNADSVLLRNLKTKETLCMLHTGNTNRTTLVSTETTPTANNVINWTYE